MFLFSVLSPGFYVCYLIVGISDMIDGTIARDKPLGINFIKRSRTYVLKFKKLFLNKEEQQ